jgi:hypothetical protein
MSDDAVEGSAVPPRARAGDPVGTPETGPVAERLETPEHEEPTASGPGTATRDATSTTAGDPFAQAVGAALAAEGSGGQRAADPQRVAFESGGHLNDLREERDVLGHLTERTEPSAGAGERTD